jgi:hypothetical protein
LLGQRQRVGVLVHRRVLDHLVDRLRVDPLLAQLQRQQPLRARAVLLPALDPAPREILVVQVVPVAQARDRLIDRRRVVSLLPQALAQLPLAAGAVREQPERGRRRLPDLVLRQQVRRVRQRQLNALRQPGLDDEIGAEPERERAVDEQIDPFRVALLGGQIGDRPGDRLRRRPVARGTLAGQLLTSVGAPAPAAQSGQSSGS